MKKFQDLILIIDDSKLVLQITSDILKKDGHNIITAQTGKDGLELAKTGNPDLIILDIVMPDIDGYDVLKELKKDEFTKNIPVIMYSSKTKKEDILLAMKLGVVDYISKNCDEHIIVRQEQIINCRCKKKRMMMAKNEVNNIVIDRQDKITYITFRFTLKSENAINERKKIFTGAFLKTLADTVVIFDYRLINDMDAGEIAQLKYLFSLFPNVKCSLSAVNTMRLLHPILIWTVKISFSYRWEMRNYMLKAEISCLKSNWRITNLKLVDVTLSPRSPGV